jgi:allophanate hydrolase subunit 1
MIAKDIDSKSAGQFAWFAARDARMRNYANSTLYTEAQKLKAERMKLVLEMVYSAKKVHINYRKTFVAIKVDSARIRDAKTLKMAEQDWSNDGITKVVSDQGVVYRFQ